jgi:hypothetical protein
MVPKGLVASQRPLLATEHIMPQFTTMRQGQAVTRVGGKYDQAESQGQ